jgi:hypothetical protein
VEGGGGGRKGGGGDGKELDRVFLCGSRFRRVARKKKKLERKATPLFFFSPLRSFSLPLRSNQQQRASARMSFFQRVVHHLVNEVLVSGLANR